MPPCSLAEAARYWHRLGWLSFGGPAGQIAMMHTDLVERRQWIDERSFSHGLNYCLLLPGPEAMQLACYLGWRLHGVAGGLLAGSLFVLPGALLMVLLSWAFLQFGQLPAVTGLLLGLQAAVLGVIAHAIAKLAGRVLRTPLSWLLAGAAMLCLTLGWLPFPVLLVLLGLIGVMVWRWRPAWLPPAADAQPTSNGTRRPRPGRALLLAAALLLAWWLPLLLLRGWLGGDSTSAQMGSFFSLTALVTVGGAYAVLPFVAQHATAGAGWLSPEQMLVGLGLAETTPGPLILVLLFVGFTGGWQQPDLASPLASALLGTGTTLWATFLPCFLFVLPVAPWIEGLRRWPAASAALTAISAAVVGVMAHLGYWFGQHLLAASSGLDRVFILLLAAGTLALLRPGRIPLPLLILGAGLMGSGWRLLVSA